jgi:hypothetical protein
MSSYQAAALFTIAQDKHGTSTQARCPSAAEKLVFAFETFQLVSAGGLALD